jgi:hypothetical protein
VRKKQPPKRRHVPALTETCAALFALGLIPYDDAKQMTARQFRSLFHFDHNVLHALGGTIHFTNLAPMLIKPHRRKSTNDRKLIEKTYRNEEKWREFTRKMISPRRKPHGRKAFNR